VRPAGSIHVKVKVLFRPERRNGQPDGKDVRREAESEESRRQSAGLTNRNRIESGQAGWIGGMLCAAAVGRRRKRAAKVSDRVRNAHYDDQVANAGYLHPQDGEEGFFAVE